MIPTWYIDRLTQCRWFFSLGYCSFGERCRYSHDPDAAPLPVGVCRAFAANGRCSRMAACRVSISDGKAHKTGATTPLGKGRSVHTELPTAWRQKYVAEQAEVPPHSRVDFTMPLASALAQVSITDEPTSSTAASDSIAPMSLPPHYKPYSMDDSNEIDEWIAVNSGLQLTESADKSILCPYDVLGTCYFGWNCRWLHGKKCDYCEKPVLHPTDEEANKTHIRECMQLLEADMEQAFAEMQQIDDDKATRQKNANAKCGICMEVVAAKRPVASRRFGILPNCRHVFCIECIRKWRCSNDFDKTTVRACPECRTVSDFVVPSHEFVGCEKEKQRLVEVYKNRLKSKDCRNYNKGRGRCKFGNKCFYRHVDEQGNSVALDSPETMRRKRREVARQRAADGAGAARGGGRSRRRLPAHVLLWDFTTVDDDLDELDMHLNQWMYSGSSSSSRTARESSTQDDDSDTDSASAWTARSIDEQLSPTRLRTRAVRRRRHRRVIILGANMTAAERSRFLSRLHWSDAQGSDDSDDTAVEPGDDPRPVSQGGRPMSQSVISAPMGTLGRRGGDSQSQGASRVSSRRRLVRRVLSAEDPPTNSGQ